MRAKATEDGEGKFYGVSIKCPGCGTRHNLPTDWLPPGQVESPYCAGKPHWTFNGNLDLPTFTPSILATWSQWNGDDLPDTPHVCHSFVTDGKIQFLGDCTHELANQTVDLPEIGE